MHGKIKNSFVKELKDWKSYLIVLTGAVILSLE